MRVAAWAVRGEVEAGETVAVGMRGRRGALGRALHRTGALAHGLADIWLNQAGQRAGARRGAHLPVARVQFKTLVRVLILKLGRP